MFAVIGKNKFTGVMYSTLNAEIFKHHEKYGQSFAVIAEPLKDLSEKPTPELIPEEVNQDGVVIQPAQEKMCFHEPDYGIPTNDQKMAFVRYQRDELIADTDWTQVPDAQLSESKRIEFAEYRQALRDIPQAYSNPDDVVWPVKPTL